MNEANRRALRVTAYDVTDRLWAMFWKSLTALCVTIAIVIGILTGIKVAQLAGLIKNKPKVESITPKQEEQNNDTQRSGGDSEIGRGCDKWPSCSG